MSIIPWGNSELNSLNGAQDAMAEDFNKNLHEHFKVMRAHKMKPAGRIESDFYYPESKLHPETGDVVGTLSRGFVGRMPPGSEGEAEQKFTTLHHNRKTGGVTAYSSPGAEYTNGMPVVTRSARKLDKALEKGALNRRDQQLGNFEGE